MPFSINVVVEDAKGKRSTTTFAISDLTDWGDAKLVAAKVAQLVANITTGQVVDVGICLSIFETLSLINNTQDVSSDVEAGALFLWRNEDAQPARNRIPAVPETIFISGSEDVDTGNADVAAFIAAMTTGVTITGGTVASVPITDYRGTEITTYVQAYENFQASRR